MAFDWKVIGSFGGGLAFDRHPAFLNDDEWSGCDGWYAKDGYAEIRTAYVPVKLPGGGWPPVGGRVCGIVQSPFSPRNAAVIGTAPGTAGGPRLFTMRDDGTTTEITPGGDTQGGTTLPSGLSNSHLPAAFLDGYLVVSFGKTAGPAYSLVRWKGGATYQTIKPVGFDTFVAAHLASFGGHLIAAHGLSEAAFTGNPERMVFVSDADVTDVWKPAIANSADFFALDDALSGITAVAPLGDNALGIFTRDATYSLSPTGSIPPFTRQLRSGRGCLDELYAGDNLTFEPYYIQRIGRTPVGVFFRGANDFYLSDAPVGRKVFRYYAQHVGGPGLVTVEPVPEFKFHDTDGLVLIILSQGASVTATQLLLFDPATGAWARTALPDVASPWCRHGFIYDNHSGAAVRAVGRHWLAAVDGTIYAESFDATVAHPLASVDTKDFSFGSPPATAEVDRIKLDWEDLGGDAVLEVFAATRDDFGAGVSSSSGGDTAPAFTSVGILAYGISELPVRLRGKFVRFRVQLRSGGKARIRGLAIRYQVETDKARSRSGYGSGLEGGGSYGGA